MPEPDMVVSLKKESPEVVSFWWSNIINPMQVTLTSFTIAEYCSQMEANSIIVNREYQRSSKVWPPAARSYLIDTILTGYPIPKVSLFQKTDLKSRTTVKEIVDGQQRSTAILDFYQDKLKITGNSEYAGNRYSDLEPDLQQRFIGYSVSADLFVNATQDNIRQLFRRINSYTVPLNPQETRHATHQGLFKWFIVDASDKYATTFKTLGVFRENQLSRMADGALLTEISGALMGGIKTSGKKILDGVYTQHETDFAEQSFIETRFTDTFSQIVTWRDLHGGNLMKPFVFFTLFLAITHFENPVSFFNGLYQRDAPAVIDHPYALSNLTALASALDNPEGPSKFKEFTDACSEATNTKNQREIRFKWLCRALEPKLLE